MFWCQAHRADFEALAGGSTYPEVSKPKVREVPIDLPPLADQRRIVDLLASLDGVIRSSEQLVVSIDAAGSSLRQAIFAADTTDVLPLGELCVPGGIQIGPFGSQLHARDYVTDGIPVVMPRDMIDGAISEDHVSRVSPADASRLARHRLEPGDVLLARRGDLTKRAFVLDEQRGWLCGTGSVRVRVTKVAPEVVFEALSTPETNRWLADHAVGITLPNLNTDIVSGIPVRLPTNPEASVRAIADMRACRALAERHARAARFLRASLVQDLFSGTTEIPASYDRFLDGAA
jgi:type I restriction enzyme S subunit